MEDVFFDEKERIRSYELINGKLALVSKSGHILPNKDQSVFYDETDVDILVDKRLLKLAIYDSVNTRVEKKCSCGNKIAVLFRYNQQTIYLCDSCEKVLD